MTEERPASVTAVVWLTRAVVALTGVAAVLAIVFSSELTDAWRNRREDVGSVEAPSIVPVVVVMLVVIATLVLVLLEFVRARHGWARIVLSVLVVLVALWIVATLRIGPPALFVVLAIVVLVLDLAILVPLWRRDTTAYLQDAPASHHSSPSAR